MKFKMKSLKHTGTRKVCDNYLHMEVADQSFRGDQRNLSRVRHRVFGGYAQVAPMPLSKAESDRIPLSVAMGSHRCPDRLFLASCWARYPWKLRFQKVHPLKSDLTKEISIDEAFGAHRCPSHLFLASSSVQKLRALYARVFPERIESHNNISLSEVMGAHRCPVHLFVASQYKEEYYKMHGKVNSDISRHKRRLYTFGSGLTIYPEGGAVLSIPSETTVEVKKHSVVGRIARRCLKSLRRMSKK